MSSSKENRVDNGNDNEGSGKVANDHNSTGDQPTTQTNQGRRTPESRNDRETHVGSGNQNQSRQNGGGGGNRGAG